MSSTRTPAATAYTHVFRSPSAGRGERGGGEEVRQSLLFIYQLHRVYKTLGTPTPGEGDSAAPATGVIDW